MVAPLLCLFAILQVLLAAGGGHDRQPSFDNLPDATNEEEQHESHESTGSDVEESRSVQPSRSIHSEGEPNLAQSSSAEPSVEESGSVQPSKSSHSEGEPNKAQSSSTAAMVKSDRDETSSDIKKGFEAEATMGHARTHGDLGSGGQHEIELPKAKPVDKFWLVLIEMMCLGFCGLDRCYMGQYCLGALKGMTMGGLLFWQMIDTAVVYSNGLNKKTSIDTLGYTATFTEDSIAPAYVGSIIGTIILIIQVLNTLQKAKAQADNPDEVAPGMPGYEVPGLPQSQVPRE